MRTEVRYFADDGREFDNMKECENYEKEVMSIMKTAKDLQNYCISHTCCSCAFHTNGCILQVPCEWKLDESGD